MSIAAKAETLTSVPWQLSWATWLRQIIAIIRLEAGKNFFGKRALVNYLLAALPVALLAAFASLVSPQFRMMQSPAAADEFFAHIYESLILRVVVFFGCSWIFMNLFRGEIIDKSLHYYFLSAVRREVVMVGKFFSGLLSSMIVFSFSTALSIVLFYVPRGYSASVEYIFQGPGLRHIVAYLAATVLGCVGYGALFLLIGMLFRNPIIPALVIYGWEFINFLLPPILKKVSVVHYLQSLLPVPLSEGPFAIVSEPTPIWVAVPGLLVFSTILLGVAGWKVRRMEIKYGVE